PASRLRWLLAVFVMFHLTCIGWLLFRADSLAAAGRMVACLAGGTPAGPSVFVYLELIAFYAGPLFLWEAYLGGEPRLGAWLQRPWPEKACVLIYLVVMLLLFGPDTPHEFIYFQF